jgi:hypothetical protein
MTNPVKTLIQNILTETKSDTNLEKELLNDLTKETKEYYKILNQRAKDNQHIAKLELKMLKEKIYKNINAHRIVIEGALKNSNYPKPLDIVYGFDTKKRDQLIDKYTAMPNVEWVGTRQITENDNFF